MSIEISVPMSVSLVANWLENAQPGDKLTYHRGFLAIDAEKKTPSPGAMARYLLNQALTKYPYIHLVQRKHGPGDYEYIAIRRRVDGE